MRAYIILICGIALCVQPAAGASPPSSSLGRLSNYYRDCPASHGPHAAYVRKTVRRALFGDHAAMRLLIMHEDLFSTGDNEAYSEVPEALLLTLGDKRYPDFVAKQPRAIQILALGISPEQIPSFDRRFPNTSRIYRELTARRGPNV